MSFSDRALEAGFSKPLFVTVSEKEYPDGSLVSLLGALHALYVVSDSPRLSPTHCFCQLLTVTVVSIITNELLLFTRTARRPSPPSPPTPINFHTHERNCHQRCRFHPHWTLSWLLNPNLPPPPPPLLSLSPSSQSYGCVSDYQMLSVKLKCRGIFFQMFNTHNCLIIKKTEKQKTS